MQVRLHRVRWPAIAIWLAATATTAVGQVPPGLVEETLQHEGRTRSYLLDPAETVPASERRPLILVLHGGRGTAERTANTLGFGVVGEREGVVVAYPRAVENNWNDGRGVDRYYSHREEVDDVGFLLAVVDDLIGRHDVDPGRVFATGPSNGGMMSLRLALEAPERFAAVAAVIANLPLALTPPAPSARQPNPSVPLLLMNGTDDPMMPYRGGEITFAGRGGFGEVRSTLETVRVFAKLQGCAGSPEITRLPNEAPLDGTRVVLHRYEKGSPRCDLSLYAVRRGGHTWPGTRSRLPPRFVGRTSRDLDATETIWEFFSTRSRDPS